MARIASSTAIERVLASGKPFQVDQINCMKHASVLKSFRRFHEPTLWSEKPRSAQLAFKLSFISICHQFNWDFLQAAIYRLLLEHDVDIVETLCTVTSKDIDTLLAESPDKARFRSKERARLLRNIGEVLKTHYDSDLERLYRECESASLGDKSFHKLLDRFEAYKLDPLKKKTNVLSHDLYSEGIVRLVDPGNLEPAIDYHIMRVYLRTGRVICANHDVESVLKGSPNPRHALVKALRQYVSDAAKLTAAYAGLNVADLNFFEWQIGRSACVNVKPKCNSKKFAKPLSTDVGALCSKGCAYRKECVARNENKDFLQLEEPAFTSTAY